MSASFAKAIMPRFKKNGELQKEPDWDPGWIYPIKIDHHPERDADTMADSQLRVPTKPASSLERDKTNLKDCS